MNDFSKNIIKSTYTIRQALMALSTLGRKANLTLFIVNDSNQLIGTLTDGDIRRALLSGKVLEDDVNSIMFKNFRYLESNSCHPEIIRKFRKEEIELLPLLDENKHINRIIDLSKTVSLLPVDVVIMAGGEGKRLSPLTNNIPKPLLKIGGKPILEYTIDRLKKFGIDNLYITVNYLKEKIIDYFGNGDNKLMNIQYIKEDKPLGTIGAISLIKDFSNDYILIMNSDLLTNIDFEDLFLTFIEKKADMVVASIPYKIKVPYATLDVNDSEVKSFQEKPTYTYYSNAGIYLIRKELLTLIPHNTPFNATDLMEKIVEQNLKLISYPILGYWLDIGKPEDYEKAQEDIRHLKWDT